MGTIGPQAHREFSENLFQEGEVRNLSPETVIHRVLQEGNYKDWQAMGKYFSLAQIQSAAQNLTWMSEVDLEFFATLFDLPEESFKAWRPRPQEPLIDENWVREMLNLQGLRPFFLGGGAALSLHLNHRPCRDYDYFTWNEISKVQLIQAVGESGKIVHSAPQLVTMRIEGRKVDFVQHFSSNPPKNIMINGIRTLPLIVLAWQKLEALLRRNKISDYVDLAYIFRHHTLAEILSASHGRLKKITNERRAIRLLLNFKSLRGQVMPETRDGLTWPEVEIAMKNAVKTLWQTKKQ